MSESNERSNTPLPDLSAAHRTIYLPVPRAIKIAVLVIVFFLITPLLMYIAWLLNPGNPQTILFVDKTSLTKAGLERASLYWALRHHKITKSDGRFYTPELDYRGFVPIRETTYVVTGLETFSDAQIDSLAERMEAAYFIDTYGVLAREWNPEGPERTEGMLYGGLSEQDLKFIETLRRQGKPLIAEFNFLASPTQKNVREKAEAMLGIRWTGWIGRYYESLDSADQELPRWVIELFIRQNGSWNYRHPGVVLVHSDETVVVLEEGGLLLEAMPIIRTEDGRIPGLAEEVPYPFWFDVTVASSPANGALSYFHLQTTPRGDSLLARYQLRSVFPAVLESKAGPRFVYIAMDASDNPVPASVFSSLAGIEIFQQFFYSKTDKSDRRNFFWDYYLPLVRYLFDKQAP